MSSSIKPTIGRVVWFWPNPEDCSIPTAGDQPLAATVSYVHNDNLVNLSIANVDGEVHGRTNVKLRQPDDERPSESFAEWMPYQIAATTEVKPEKKATLK